MLRPPQQDRKVSSQPSRTYALTPAASVSFTDACDEHDEIQFDKISLPLFIHPAEYLHRK
jgi:hypothetical protein